MSFFNKYGLLNSKEGEGVAENSPLWTWELFLIANSYIHYNSLGIFIGLCKTHKEGLYGQRPVSDNNGSAEDYMSPDQLIPIAGYFMMNNSQEVKRIWRYLWAHIFTYDNLSGKINFSRIMQPAAIFFVAACAGHKWAIPILTIICMISCYGDPDQTTGKLKAWTMIETLSMKKTKKVCSYILKKRCNFKTWSECFIEYFPMEGHPIKEIALKRQL